MQKPDVDYIEELLPAIAVELIDLGELSIAGWSPNLPKDDFDAILPKLKDRNLAD